MEQTPLIRQYLDIKKSYPDALLLFRVGDFYEMFFEDAVSASRILNIALTSRDKSREEAVPLCGIPYHALNNYLGKLIKAGLQVAICEQMEDPRMVKGIVKREVVRVISPGTLIESELLDSRLDNYFAAIYIIPGTAGLAYLDISTGDFNLNEFEGNAALNDLNKELANLLPREILAPEGGTPNAVLKSIELNPNWKIHRRPSREFLYESALDTLTSHFKVSSLSAYGCENQRAAVSAAGALLSYLLHMVKTPLSHVTRLNRIHTEAFMAMDPATQKSLELTQNAYDGKREHSLLWVFDRCQTPMGSRLVKRWITRPLVRREEIEKRLESVDCLNDQFELSNRLKNELCRIQDLERIMSRITLKGCTARDFINFKNSLFPLKSVQKLLQIPLPALLQSLLEKWDNLEDLYRLINEAILDDPPLSLREGSFIREGYSPEIDQLKSFERNMKATLLELEKREKARTGIESLKIRYNQVSGYYIEVSKQKSGQVPRDYQRKQTLTNAERYTIAELAEFEIKIKEAEQTVKNLEDTFFETIRMKISSESSRVLSMANSVAILDVLLTFSEVARQNRYVHPEMESEPGFKIVEGRHPVIERILPSGQFVPNDIFLGSEAPMMIITGPNMAGKSTFMRQVALIVVMAQMGSFVPAQECALGIVDRLYTRIGAADYLTQGQSTFMVEMTETANILNNATPQSLILLDEIGRGTSTYDGISIAWAIAEYILKHQGTRTLFATHYHELTALAQTQESARNYNISVKEWNDEIIFLRKIVPGAADQSYGIQVARLAGLPPEIIKRAKEILYHLEEEALDAQGLPRFSRSSEPDLIKEGEIDLFLSSLEVQKNQAVEIIRKADVVNMTPLEALNLIHRLKTLLESKMDPPG